jgi:hypothetical protein
MIKQNDVDGSFFVRQQNRVQRTLSGFQREKVKREGRDWINRGLGDTRTLDGMLLLRSNQEAV